MASRRSILIEERRKDRQRRIRGARLDYRKGVLHVEDIVQKWRVPRYSLYKGLKKKRGRLPSLTQRERDQIIELNYQGVNDTAIAHRLGRGQTTISKWRRNMGLPVVPRKG